jgi:hypothetical protein
MRARCEPDKAGSTLTGRTRRPPLRQGAEPWSRAQPTASQAPPRPTKRSPSPAPASVSDEPAVYLGRSKPARSAGPPAPRRRRHAGDDTSPWCVEFCPSPGWGRTSPCATARAARTGTPHDTACLHRVGIGLFGRRRGRRRGQPPPVRGSWDRSIRRAWHGPTRSIGLVDLVQVGSESGRISCVASRRSCHRSVVDGRPQNQ